MKIKIRDLIDAGIPNQERIVIDVLENTDIGQYALSSVRVSAKPDGYFTVPNSFYWFPDGPVKKGDVVVLYTKSGARSTTNNQDRSTSHFYYWGNPNTIFTDQPTIPVLLEMTWSFHHRRATAL